MMAKGEAAIRRAGYYTSCATGNTYRCLSTSFAGALGLAPNWETGATTQNDRNWISSCMLAHINTTGQHIGIYLDGMPPVGWGRNSAYPVQEGTFLGDIFASPPTARYCGGRGYGSNVVAGRIGANQSGAPYSVLTSASGSTRCDAICARDSSGDGYSACAGLPFNPITVWRQFVSAPALSFETSTQGFTSKNSTQPTSLMLSGAEHLSGSNSMLLMVNATGAGYAFVELLDASAVVKPGKNMTFFIKIPAGTNWSYVQTYAQDGPAKNYRWSAGGYLSSEVLPSEWNSVVVPIPADFAVTGSKVGVQLNLTGAGTTKLYVDGLFFDN
jgi:hypothetical protein